ncbi:sigma-70 family RNA polymerase sigma factor [Halomonas shantousis]
MTAQPLDQLFHRHSRELTGYLARRLGSPDLADDLCHEVYLRLCRTTPRIPLHNPRAYLFRITRNLLIDYQRHSRTQPLMLPLDAPELLLESASSCPETATRHAQCRQWMRDMLERLPTRQRQALIWHRLEGLTQREIGQRLGVSERMAGRYVQQALQHCRAHLGETSF